MGFRSQNPADYRDRLELRKGLPYDRDKRNRDIRLLFSEGKFRDVRIEPDMDAEGNVYFTIIVEEYPAIKDIVVDGLKTVPLSLFSLHLQPGTLLDPFLLKSDRDQIQGELLSRGHYFATVREELVDTPEGTIVHWYVSEGPVVTVRAIEFSGNANMDSDTLKDTMRTKESGFLRSGDPFQMRLLEEDLKRLKILYQNEGWVEVLRGERLFVEDLEFSLDRTEVTIHIHIDEGRRYRIRSVRFEGNTVFTDDELRQGLGSEPGDDYSDRQANADARLIRQRYGEKAYILAVIDPQTIYAMDDYELDLKFSIVENQEITVGKILIQGNRKTRFDVILRELKDFTPGEKFNNRLLSRGLNRLFSKGYFSKIEIRQEAGPDPAVRDVIIDLEEMTTGRIQFAGGYHSGYGLLGVIEFQQQNFDITDLPHSVEDFFSGNAFAGGGQNLRIRYQPSTRQQAFVVSFREPYFFGYEFGVGVGGQAVVTRREAWDEENHALSLTLEKRLDPFILELGLRGTILSIEEIEPDAPSTVRRQEGENRLLSATPQITFDTREDYLYPQVPTQGQILSVSYEWAGDPLPGDFDYGKIEVIGETYFPVYRSEPHNPTSKWVHILKGEARFGWVHARGDSEVPFWERFYGGGRGSIRGFDFRGISPLENGQPVGGEATALFTVEYTYPLLVDYLRGAFFYDLANVTEEIEGLAHEKWRNSVGFGIRFVIPQMVNLPVALDFGFPLTKRSEDDRQTVTFDIRF